MAKVKIQIEIDEEILAHYAVQVRKEGFPNELTDKQILAKMLAREIEGKVVEKYRYSKLGLLDTDAENYRKSLNIKTDFVEMKEV